jgi:hypothetical protein
MEGKREKEQLTHQVAVNVGGFSIQVGVFFFLSRRRRRRRKKQKRFKVLRATIGAMP